MYDIFAADYLAPRRLALLSYTESTSEQGVQLSAEVELDGVRRTVTGAGTGPIDAFVHALSEVDINARVLDYAEHAMSAGGDARAAAYLECSVGGETYWGVGIDPNIVAASLHALTSAINRAGTTG